MTDVGALASTAYNNAQSSRSELSGNFDVFLKMLTTQLQNQDPLEPTDTSEFTQQLVQYSQVEQSIKSNEQLASLVSLQSNLQVQSALGYIGKEVRVPEAQFNYKGSGDYTFDYALPKEASKCTISILNEKGEVVYSTPGKLEGNKLHNFVWDGKTNQGTDAAAGKYKIKVAAVDEDSKSMTTQTAVWGTVKGMETTSDGDILLDLDGISVSISDVLAAREKQQTN